MSVSSINDHIKPPKGAAFIRAGAHDGWFVITYEVEGRSVQFFYNQMGREVFRVDSPRVNVVKRFLKWIGDSYANPDFTQNV